MNTQPKKMIFSPAMEVRSVESGRANVDWKGTVSLSNRQGTARLVVDVDDARIFAVGESVEIEIPSPPEVQAAPLKDATPEACAQANEAPASAQPVGQSLRADKPAHPGLPFVLTPDEFAWLGVTLIGVELTGRRCPNSLLDKINAAATADMVRKSKANLAPGL